MTAVLNPVPAGTIGVVANGTDLYDAPNGTVLRKTSAEVTRSILLATANNNWYGIVTVTDNRVVFVEAAQVSGIHVPPVAPTPPPVPTPDGLDELLTELVKRLIPIVQGAGIGS